MITILHEKSARMLKMMEIISGMMVLLVTSGVIFLVLIQKMKIIQLLIIMLMFQMFINI